MSSSDSSNFCYYDNEAYENNCDVIITNDVSLWWEPDPLLPYDEEDEVRKETLQVLRKQPDQKFSETKGEDPELKEKTHDLIELSNDLTDSYTLTGKSPETRENSGCKQYSTRKHFYLLTFTEDIMTSYKPFLT